MGLRNLDVIVGGHVTEVVAKPKDRNKSAEIVYKSSKDLKDCFLPIAKKLNMLPITTYNSVEINFAEKTIPIFFYEGDKCIALDVTNPADQQTILSSISMSNPRDYIIQRKL